MRKSAKIEHDINIKPDINNNKYVQTHTTKLYNEIKTKMVCNYCKNAGHSVNKCALKYITNLMSIMNTGKYREKETYHSLMDESERPPNHPDFDSHYKIKSYLPENPRDWFRSNVSFGRRIYNWGLTKEGNVINVYGCNLDYAVSMQFLLFSKLLHLKNTENSLNENTNELHLAYFPTALQRNKIYPRRNSSNVIQAYKVIYNTETSIYSYTTVEMTERNLSHILFEQITEANEFKLDFLFIDDHEERLAFKQRFWDITNRVNRHREELKRRWDEEQGQLDQRRQQSRQQIQIQQRLVQRRQNSTAQSSTSQQAPPLCKMAEKAFDSTACQICMEDFQEVNKGTLRCGHQFCMGCIFTWCNNNDSCPTCRSKIK